MMDGDGGVVLVGKVATFATMDWASGLAFDSNSSDFYCGSYYNSGHVVKFDSTGILLHQLLPNHSLSVCFYHCVTCR